MKELVDRLFPEPDEPNILGGMTDFTSGRATEYFTGLNPDDRALVQWYLQRYIGPLQTETYAFGLVKAYAVIDPERKNKDAIQSAHEELQRTERFLGIFLRSKDFFPKIERVNLLVKDEFGKVVIDEHGKAEHILEVGWTRYSSSRDMGWRKGVVRKGILPLFPHIHAFLDNPNGAPLHFDQDEVLKKFQQQRDEPLS